MQSLNTIIMKKIFLFDYFYQKCVLKVQELLKLGDDLRASQLGVIVSKTRMFHRTANSCNMEEICFCNPMYVQELFLYFCYRMDDKGELLLKNFNFHRFISYLPGMYSVECYEDKEITYHLEKLYPVVSSKSEIEYNIFKKILGTCTDEELEEKFRHISNFRGTKTLAMENIPTAKPEIAMIDETWRKLENDEEFLKMLIVNCKHDHNGRSHAYNTYFNKMKI